MSSASHTHPALVVAEAVQDEVLVLGAAAGGAAADSPGQVVGVQRHVAPWHTAPPSGRCVS